MNIFNIFKKRDKIVTSEGTIKEVIKSDIKPIIMCVNNSNYIIEDSSYIKVQSSSDDVQVYGWTLEAKYDNGDGRTHWYTHWNHRIYQSRESAVDASLKIGVNFNKEYRIMPLYIMTQPQYRDYKIDKVLGNKPVVKKEVKGWKLKEEYVYHSYKNPQGVTVEYKYKKGSVFIQLESGQIVKSGNSNEHTCGISNGYLKEMISNNLVDEVKIEDEKWLHPHLLRVLKNKFKIK